MKQLKTSPGDCLPHKLQVAQRTELKARCSWRFKSLTLRRGCLKWGFLRWNVTNASPVEEIGDTTGSLHITNHSRGRLHLTRLVTNTKTYQKNTHF